MSPQNQELTVGSLFAGIGGLELGLERAGMRVLWQVEKDAFCRKVLAKHWPSVTRFEDVKDVGRSNLAPVDLICGGFPCQDISHPGKRAGIVAGNQSGLWHEYARIIREMGPRYVLVENVAALLARGLDIVLGDLATLGYDAEWSVLPACAFGAPHTRERVFILAYTRCESGLQTDSPPHANRGIRGSRGDARRSHWAAVPAPDWSLPEAVSHGVVNGIPNRLDAAKALGNSVSPEVSEYIGRLIVEADKEMRGAA